jgi:glycosyltransferase involved in cell wall biosynthesis
MSTLGSIIIPCFNAARWISETLDSVIAQHIEGLEIIAVNDGSADDTAAIIRANYPTVRVIETENRGVSYARNLGMETAQGRYFQFLDADDLLAPGKLVKQVAALENTGADVAYGDWNKLQLQADGAFRSVENVARMMGEPAEIALFTDFWCPLAAYLFRKEIVNKVGSWNTGLPVIQDARFTLDCALYGATFTYVPGIAASYRTHSGSSLSTRNPQAALADQLHNAQEIEAWWTARGGVSGARQLALTKVYGHIARASYESDRKIFQAACAALERLEPAYVPASPKSLAILSRVTGYRKAESLALGYRRIKRVFSAA